MRSFQRGLRQFLTAASAVLVVTTAFTAVSAPRAGANSGLTAMCPCTAFSPSSTPVDADTGDPNSVELGVKVRASQAGDITGIRFYKSAANIGTHTGSLWAADGTQLATGTFTNETATGWQSLAFATPVPVKANATYTASYHAPYGHYSSDWGFNGSGTGLITALAGGVDGPDGVYAYGPAPAFPTAGYNSSNYWVDAVFDTAGVPTTAPAVTSTTPASAASGVASKTSVTATFSAPMDPATLSFTLAEKSGPHVPGTLTYDAASQTATFTPSTQLALGATFTASVQGADVWGRTMASTTMWSFTTGTTPPAYTCPCSMFDTGATPAVADSGEYAAVELGIRFTSAINGTVTGIRFYKGTANTGTHTGTLWTANGALLATGTFTNESASGWQKLTFATPVTVTADTLYVASYYAPNGNYSYTTGYLGYPHIDYPLTAQASTPAQGNGTYNYGSSSAFPGTAGNGTNYWVDVTFNAS